MSLFDDPDYWRFAGGREGVMPTSDSGASEYPHWGADCPKCPECGAAINEDIGCTNEECVVERWNERVTSNQENEEGEGSDDK
mgnify:CR=1 FL=1